MGPHTPAVLARDPICRVCDNALSTEPPDRQRRRLQDIGAGRGPPLRHDGRGRQGVRDSTRAACVGIASVHERE